MSVQTLNTLLVPGSPSADVEEALARVAEEIDGDVRVDPIHRMLYAQDASVYWEEPLGVVFPRSTEDVQAIVRLADTLGIELIPRAAGTSLAGQCVGTGLVVDTGRHMNRILSIDPEAMSATVQPGVILDELNREAAKHGLLFGPDTSTSNRCMLGGMIGNNSCGAHSILYGTTRDHILELEVVLSDGELVRINPWDGEQLAEMLEREGRLGDGLRVLDRIVREHGPLIRERYPKPGVMRRNTGYAFDAILDQAPYTDGGAAFDLAKLLCGSEGTLAMTTEATVSLDRLPGAKNVVVAHFASIEEALRATVVAVGHEPAAVELIDKRILDLAKQNIEQARNRFFIEGDPEAILVVEFYREDVEALEVANRGLIEDYRSREMGYAYPVLSAPEDKAVWELRKAGLGILFGMRGDVKPVTVVEDTAVAVEVLPEYISEFAEIMERHDTACVYYAHASVGELHLRPELNMRDPDGAQKFKKIATEVTDLVKKHGGSISGEHGDGRLRSPMLKQFFGPELTQAHVELKHAFDPKGILNPGKIVEPKAIDEDWRFEPGQELRELDTLFDWSLDGGLIRAVEKCNGAGVCRKTAAAGGTMCPSYMVTLEEKDSTRGRANVFRNLFLNNEDPREALESDELHDVLDLCLSCKGCKSECPASVDMTRMKTEFLQHHHDAHGAPLSAHLFARYGQLSKLAAWTPWLANFMFTFALTRWIMGKLMGLAPERSMPAYARKTFSSLYKRWRREHPADTTKPVVGVYIDPFCEFTEPEIGMATVRVLEASGWRVARVPIEDDGRTQLSKGFVRDARALAEKNVRRATEWLKAHPEAKIVGVEPSALLTFRDEVPDLVSPDLREDAEVLAARCLLLDEFITQHKGDDAFTSPFGGVDGEPLILHGHCHQKAIVGLDPTVDALTLAGYDVTPLKTGCCGMAGSFGYEKDHYELSMSVGELVLFPAVREADEKTHVAAPGTSCRHQIMDGTGRVAEHPAVLLERALAPRAFESI